MAHIAGRRRGNMCGSETGGDHTVMTRNATSRYLRVIHQWIHRCPRDTVVAGFAHIGGVDVCGTLARGRGAIMTGDAGISSRTVIKHHTQPRCGDVANIAGRGGGNMRCT